MNKIIRWPASLLVFGACLFLAEFAVRFCLPQLNPAHHIHFQAASETRPVLGPPNEAVRQIKNTGDFNIIVRFNADGLRDTRRFHDIRKDDFVFAGSSFTFGWGIEKKKRVSEQLEKFIGARVINVSMTAGIDNYAKMLSYAASHGAEIGRVIIAVTMETDIKNYAPPSGRAVQNKTASNWKALNIPKPDAGLMAVKTYLMRHSAMYFLVTSLIHSTPALKALAIRFGLIVPNLEGVREHRYSREETIAAAQYLARLAARYDTIVLLIPSRGLWHGDQKEAENKRHRQFVEELKKRSLNFVDLRTLFEATGDPLSLHFRNDGHWNTKGHTLAARALAGFIRTHYTGI
ncbi:MAG: hypothetical protein RIB59_13490 [Rhodospirillales bacterium]